MLPSPRPVLRLRRWIALGAFSLAGLAGLAGLAALTGCAAASPEDDLFTASPEGHLDGAAFIAHLRPRAGTLTISPALRGGVPRTPQSQADLPIVSDGIAGSGPANTVELVTNSVGVNAMCPAGFQTNTFCGNVTLRHFFGMGFNNTYVQVTRITDAAGQDIAGHSALNSNLSALGLSNSLGLWKHAAAGFAADSGQLGKSAPLNEGTRDWVFANPDNADTYVSLRVVASPTYVAYTMAPTAAAFVNACALPGASSSTSTGAVISQPLPFPFTLYGGGPGTAGFGTSMTVNYNRKGLFTFASTWLPSGSITPVNLPDNTGASVQPAIYPFWEDMTYNTGDPTSAVCTATTGSAPNRVFVITWSNLRFVGDALGKTNLTFSASLYEGTDQIVVVYGTMTSIISNAWQLRANGSGATVGLQNATGTVATGGQRGQTNTASGSAYRFTPVP